MAHESKLTDEMLEQNLIFWRGKTARIAKDLRKGRLTTAEAEIALKSAFRECTVSFLEKCGLFLTAGSSWDGLREDYLAYREGRKPESVSDAIWMRDDGLPADSGVHGSARAYAATRVKSVPASFEDRCALFRMLEKMHLPAADVCRLAFVPAAGPRPACSITHVYADCVCMAVKFPCADDGGLTEDASPVGKHFTLIDDRGLRACLKVTEKREPPFNPREMDRDGLVPPGSFLCRGSVEGYTAFGDEATNEEEAPDVIVRTDENGKINMLGLCIRSEADKTAPDIFPLWQPYYAEEKAKERELNGILLKAMTETNEEAAENKT